MMKTTSLIFFSLMLIGLQQAGASNIALPPKDKSEVLEVIILTTNHQYTGKQIIKRANSITPILRSYPGFISRAFAKNVNNPDEWTDILRWSSLHDSHIAAKKIKNTTQMKNFIMVMKRYKMYHFIIKSKIEYNSDAYPIRKIL